MKFNRTLLLVFAIAGMLPPLIFMAFRWYQGQAIGSFGDMSKSIMVSMLTTVTISYGVVSVLFWLHQQFPWKKNVAKRLVLEIVLTTLTACGLILMLSLITHFTIDPKLNLGKNLFDNLIVAVIMNFILVAITEGIFFFREWRNSEVDAERFKKESIRAQFESLKNQVNPHFLFNSLNTLSGLIDHDKEVSKEFLDDLSSIYRYVLQNRDEELVTVQRELDFIRSFTGLLKKRHGDRVAFHFNVAKEDLEKGIPPMTLQLLVENAVKHNVASRKRPLKVEIFSQNEYLVVRNNLQRKKEVDSTGVGLENIRSRYQYLIEQTIEIEETENYFQVKVPVIKMV